MPVEIKIGENAYRIGHLNAMKQWHVARRLLPCAAAVGDSVMQAMSKPDEDASVVDIFRPLFDAYARLSDEDSEYIIFTCMEVVERQQPGGWVSMKAASAKLMQFNDIDMPELLRLTMAVIKEHRLMDFTVVLPDALAPPPPA